MSMRAHLASHRPLSRFPRLVVRVALCCATFLTAVAASPARAEADGPSVTFFAWSDQHVQVDGNGEHLKPAIDAMNALPGTAYPEQVGGTVETPAFVLGIGDITEWPTHAAMRTYDELVTRRLKFPARDVIGNHDEGGRSPSDTIKNWLIKRHGALTYSFAEGGVRFVAFYSPYDESLNNPAQPLRREALADLREQLSQAPPDTPTIVATHLCYDAITNKDELVEVLQPFHVPAILGGHYHKAKVDRYRQHVFVQIPSPAPGSPSEFMVFRVTPERIVAVPYDYEQKQWVTDSRKMLDMPLPASAP